MKTASRPRFAHPAILLLALSLATLSVASADSPLEKCMERMKKAYKALALGLEKPQESNQSTYVSLAETIKSSATESRDFVPKLAESLPPDQKTAMVKSFREDMDSFVVSVDGLIQNLKASKWEEANKDMANLKNEMRDGHREFRKD
ncbi:MAG: cytochrome b562 [Verrucomicrobiota bacterium]